MPMPTDNCVTASTSDVDPGTRSDVKHQRQAPDVIPARHPQALIVHVDAKHELRDRISGQWDVLKCGLCSHGKPPSHVVGAALVHAEAMLARTRLIT